MTVRVEQQPLVVRVTEDAEGMTLDMEGGITLTIEGGDLWAVPQDAAEAARMADYASWSDHEPARCGTCAFRPGTEANRAKLTLSLVESCLLSGQTFMCHHGLQPGENPTRPCAGYVAIAKAAE